MQEQIFEGLSRNLPTSKGEFVIKLIPEGLGEITVRLLSSEGRTTLRMITASAETARLINQDLPALQNALKPIKVEVQQAVQETHVGQDANAYYQGFDQFNQFSQYHQYQSQHGEGRYFGAADSTTDGELIEEGYAGYSGAGPPGQELDLYV